MITLPSTRGFAKKAIIDVVSVPTTWDIGIRTTATNKQMRLNVVTSGASGDVTIDWGDGTIQTVESFGGSTVLHNYANVAQYTIKISGAFGGTGGIAISATSGPLVISTSAIPNMRMHTFADMFRSCRLTKIPSNLFHYNTALVTDGNIFRNTFTGCTLLTSIPVDLFRYHTSMTNNAFATTFGGCTNLTNIPADLFRYNTGVTTFAFRSTFQGCTGLTSIPAGLFQHNTGVTSQVFYATFQNCTGLTSIPVDLFRYNTGMTSSAFSLTFRGCTGLTSIPTDLFRYNTGVTTVAFEQTFMSCTGLNGYAVQADLLRYNTLMSGTSTASSMFNGVTLDTVAYSNLLISLNTYLTQSNVGFGAGSSKYDSSASAARAALVSRGWSIVDGGLA